MNRRVLVDSIGEEAGLAKLGVVTNLVFDRLLTITDDAGLAAGEPQVVQGKCFSLMPEMTIKKVAAAIDELVASEFLYRGVFGGRIVVLFRPDAFQKHQALRRDYKRRFNYGTLSEVVWQKGLPGFRSEAERVTHGIVASGTVSVSVSVSDSVTVTGAHARKPNGPEEGGQKPAEEATGHSPEFDAFWKAYPRKKAKGDAWKAWQAAKPAPDVETVLIAIEHQRHSPQWTKDGGQFVPYPATWLRRQGWLDEPDDDPDGIGDQNRAGGRMPTPEELAEIEQEIQARKDPAWKP